MSRARAPRPAISAIIAGHDVRHALVTFGTDATHGYERTHSDSLTSVASLLVLYAQSPLLDTPTGARAQCP